jgi:uncharacterized protein
MNIEKVGRYNLRYLVSKIILQPRTSVFTMNARELRVLITIIFIYLYLPVICFAQATSATGPLSILFFGDRGQHNSSTRAQVFIPLMAARGINITYTENLEDLNVTTLATYNGLIVYADQVRIDPERERALLDYVASGRGFIPIHCAISFLNSPMYNALIGAKFMHHSTGRFSTRAVNPDHPIIKDLLEFETWDETYVHTKPNQDCTVLQVRREGDRDEPVTWVRTHGKGRVFYTAYGHDERTWDNPIFQSLMEHGIRWACGNDSIPDNWPEKDNK